MQFDQRKSKRTGKVFSRNESGYMLFLQKLPVFEHKIALFERGLTSVVMFSFKINRDQSPWRSK